MVIGVVIHMSLILSVRSISGDLEIRCRNRIRVDSSVSKCTNIRYEKGEICFAKALVGIISYIEPY